MRPLTIAFLAALLAASPLHAASKDADTQSTPSKRLPKSTSPRSDNPIDTKTDTQSCREQAHGLSGPERSRFMTRCLKGR